MALTIRKFLAFPFALVGALLLVISLPIRHSLEDATKIVEGFSEVLDKVKGSK